MARLDGSLIRFRPPPPFTPQSPLYSLSFNSTFARLSQTNTPKSLWGGLRTGDELIDSLERLIYLVNSVGRVESGDVGMVTSLEGNHWETNYRWQSSLILFA